MAPTDTGDTLRELRPRPSREEIDPAASELLRRYGDEVMASARRWADSPEDAEDAYQRGMEIMLTKAPSTDPDHLVPWLKTVVKREAWAIRRQRERHTPPASEFEDLDSPGPTTAHDHAERIEQLRRGAEALARLKPQEVRALVLKAEGLSYQEICDETGWTYTKVNRCLSEGRRRFQDRIAGIESGAECARLAPLLSRLADGEARAEDLALLRPHLRTCLTCRVRLRDYRAAPAKVAAVTPPVVAGGALIGWISERSASLAMRWQQAAEIVTAHKAAAVVASAAVLGGGGAATVATVDRDRSRPATSAPIAAPIEPQPRQPFTASALPSPAGEGDPRRKSRSARPQSSTSTPSGAATDRGPTAPPPGGPTTSRAEPGGEFTPDAGQPTTSTPSAPQAARPPPEPAPAAGPGSDGGEFSP